MTARVITPERALIGGLCTLIIAMGIGRFAYTPILPTMQAANGFDHAQAGLLASLNFIGYLIGALAGGYLCFGLSRTAVFRIALVASIATTALMASTDWFTAWGLLRLVSGLVSGLLFVFSADMVMRALAQHGKARLVGVHFAGVGLGIALSGLLVPLLEQWAGWRGDWLGLGAVSVVLAVPAWLWLRDNTAAETKAGAPQNGGSAPHGPSFPLAILVIAYFLEGFGYIVSGTFLVSILQTGSGAGLIGPMAWTVVGLAGAPSCILWALAAARWGAVPALVAAHLLQAVGIVLPIYSTALGPALIGAVLFGGTFMGITTLVIAFARQTTRGPPARAIGLLTAAFGLGQILGPYAAGWLASQSGGFDTALGLAAAAVVLGAVLLAAGGLLLRVATSGGNA